uniref:Band 3 cytoplasmic domain-containing protein n=1 Tax=Lepeophtheirus salmonis TaxID=72036 RepID=A0A0K2UXQ2_LEPSM
MFKPKTEEELFEIPIFTELLELIHYEDGEFEWKEFSRWIKYQEVVEEEGERWSKPHISTISLRGLLHLRKLIRNGTTLLDLSLKNSDNLNEIVDAITQSSDIGHFETSRFYHMTYSMQSPRLARIEIMFSK